MFNLNVSVTTRVQSSGYYYLSDIVRATGQSRQETLRILLQRRLGGGEIGAADIKRDPLVLLRSVFHYSFSISHLTFDTQFRDF